MSEAHEIEIVVIGDVNVDTLITPTYEDDGSSLLYRRTGGALLLAGAIEAAVQKLPGVRVWSFYNGDRSPTRTMDHEALLAREDATINRIRTGCREYVTTLDLFKKARGKPDAFVYRIKNVVGKILPRPDSSEPLRDSTRELARGLSRATDSARRRVLVVLDRNHDFRDLDPEESLVPFLRQAGDSTPSQQIVVWEMHQPLAQGALWDKFKEYEGLLDRTIVVVTIDSLRRAGVNVRDDASIEQVSQDFLLHLQSNERLKELAGCRHLIVWFEDGVLHWDRDDRKWVTDYYCRGLTGNPRLGRMVGYTSILMAAIVKRVATSLCASEDGIDESLKRLDRGIALGLVLGKRHFEEGLAGKGFYNDPDPGPDAKKRDPFPFRDLFESFDHEGPSNGADTSVAQLRLPRSLEDLRKRRWSRVKDLDGKRAHMKHEGILDIETHLRSEIVWCGVDAVIKEIGARAEESDGAHEAFEDEHGVHFPKLRAPFPCNKFGVIRTVDRKEINRFFSLTMVIRKYLDKEDWKTPLCIAVFGPPGSGKSFAINQIVHDINEDIARSPLVFNVAQFSQVKDLAVAFHQAQNRVLSNEVPLVIFDEFDATWEKERLGWLKYFLAPMQDGKFKDGESMYSIGRGIFVFAGGTASTFEEFANSAENNDTFVQAKGPDFVSRLRGHLNILGINAEDGELSPLLTFRRAIILRSILERKCKEIINKHTKHADIDGRVVRAFLETRTYKHGIRSMEAIVEMSKIERGKRFLKSSIPPKAQLNMHVDAEDFLKWLMDPDGENTMDKSLCQRDSQPGDDESETAAPGEAPTPGVKDPRDTASPTEGSDASDQQGEVLHS